MPSPDALPPEVVEVVEARKALSALFLMVPMEVARDVGAKVNIAFDALSRRAQEARRECVACNAIHDFAHVRKAEEQ